jgi:hypothetical protein
VSTVASSLDDAHAAGLRVGGFHFPSQLVNIMSQAVEFPFSEQGFHFHARAVFLVAHLN